MTTQTMATTGTESILPGVIACVADSLALEADQIQASSRLISDLGADSLDFMDILFQLEQAFDIKMQKEDLNFLEHIGMEENEAVQDGILTPAAIAALQPWLPQLPGHDPVALKDLGTYISIESMCKVVQTLQGRSM